MNVNSENISEAIRQLMPLTHHLGECRKYGFFNQSVFVSRETIAESIVKAHIGLRDDRSLTTMQERQVSVELVKAHRSFESYEIRYCGRLLATMTAKTWRDDDGVIHCEVTSHKSSES